MKRIILAVLVLATAGICSGSADLVYPLRGHSDVPATAVLAEYFDTLIQYDEFQPNSAPVTGSVFTINANDGTSNSDIAFTIGATQTRKAAVEGLYDYWNVTAKTVAPWDSITCTENDYQLRCTAVSGKKITYTITVTGAGSTLSQQENGWEGSTYCRIKPDTTNVRLYTNQSKSMTFTDITSSTDFDVYKNLASNVSLTNYDLIFSYYISPTQTPSSLNVDVILQYGTTNNYVSYAVEVGASSMPPAAGWRYIKIGSPVRAARLIGIYTLDEVLANVGRVKISIGGFTAAQSPSITLDALLAVPKQAEADYALTFDDGRDDNYVVAQYLAGKGMRATFFVITSRIGTSGYLTLAQCQQMQSWGHLIANHSYNHEYFNDYSSLADHGKYTVLSTTFTGTIELSNSANTNVATYLVGAANSVTEILDTASGYTATEDNDGTVNFYWDGAKYEINNELGATYTVYVNLSSKDARESIIKATDWLYNNGFKRGAKIWAVPGGTGTFGLWNQQATLLADCYDLCRLSNIVDGAGAYDIFGSPGSNKTVACYAFFSSTYTPATAVEILTDAVIATKPLIVLGGHVNFPAGGGDITITGADHLITTGFDTFCTLLKSKEGSTCKIITLDELAYSGYPYFCVPSGIFGNKTGIFGN